MEPFKNIYNLESITRMGKLIKAAHPDFNLPRFLKLANKDLAQLEMKERVTLISETLSLCLPPHYKKNIKILLKTLSQQRKDDSYLEDGIQGFMAWPYTTYIETYGLEDFKTSMNALKEITKRFTAEFGIRVFLEHHSKDSFKLLKVWKKDSDHHLRRLVSEGTRPRLPWGIKVLSVNENLKRNTNLIYSLRNDESEYVRKSVANHLNDISYLDEDLFFSVLNKMGGSKKEDWIKRHASRSLLKKGHPQALELHGYNPELKCSTKFKLGSKSIKEGDRLKLSLQIKTSAKDSNQKILVEYCIHYLKQNGEYSIKPFRLKDATISSSLAIEKSIHFKKVSTRKHYPGTHYISIQINGRKYGKEEFSLK